MPTWKKVVVSGSGVSQLTNDTNYLIDGQSAAALTGSFTGSFIGDGSGLTGLATNLAISGSTGNDTVDLLNDSLSVVGAGGISTTVTDNVITINSNGLVSGSVQVDITGTTGYSTFSSSLAGDIASNASAIAALDGAYATDAELSTVSGALATSIDSTASTAASNLSSTSASLASSINSEASTRLANDNTLQTNIDSEASTRTSAITAVQNDVDANETTAANNLSAASASLAVSITSVEGDLSSTSASLASSITSTASTAASNLSSASSSLAAGIATNAAAIAGLDSTYASNVQLSDASASLASSITVEQGRINAILSASSADADTFAEIVTLINSVDTTNDQAFASYYTSSNNRLTDLETDSGSFSTRVSANEAAIAGLDSTYATDAQLSSVSGALATSIDSTASTAASNLSSTSASLASSITGVATDLSNSSASLASSITANASTAATNLSNTSASLAGSIDSTASTAASNLSSTSASLASSITGVATDLSNTSASLAGSITSTASTAASNLSSASSSLAAGIATNAAAIAGLDSTYATDAQLSSVSGALATSIDSTASTAASNLSSTSASLASSITANASAIAGLDSTYATDAQLTAVSGAFETTVSSVSGALASSITVEQGRINAILSASSADKDSFAEIVTLINSVDLENDQAFAAYYTSSNNRLTDLETDSGSFSTRVSANEATIANLDGTYATDAQLSSISGALAASAVSFSSSLAADIANLDSTYATDAQLSSDSASLASSITSNASTAANNLSAASGALASSIGNVAGDLSSTSASLASSITSTASTAATNLSSTSASLAVSITANAAAIAGLDSTYATDAELSAVSGALASGLVVEKGRIDAILSASTADADTFAEIVTLINSVDTTNDQAFASYYTSSNNRLTDLETDSGSFSTRVSANETAIAGLDGTYATDAQLSAVSGAFETTIAGLTNDYNELLNVPAGIVSSSAQQVANLVGEDVVANSFTGNGSGLTNLTVAQTATIVETFSAVTSHTVTHNFGSDNILATVYDSSGFQIIPASVQATGANTVVVTFAEATSGKVIVGQGGHIVSGSIAFSSILAKPTLVSGSGQIQIDNVDGFTAFSSSVESRIDALDGTYATDAELSSVSGALASSIGNVAGDLSSTSASLASSIVGVAGDLSSTSASLAASIAGLDSTYATDAELSAVSGAFETTIAGLTNDYNELLNVPAGIVSGSTLTSPSQGTAVLTNNGVAQTADLGLQVGDSPTFASLTLTGNLTVTGDTISANVANLDVEDRFILLNSGSNSGDAGIIFGGSDGTANAGSGIFWDSPANVFGFAQAIGSADTSATHQSKLGNIEVSAGAPSGAPLFQGVGTIHVDSSTGDVLIYV